MSTVPSTTNSTPAPRAHRATTTSRMRFTPAPHSERSAAASLPKGMPVVVTMDDLGVVTLHASVDGIEDYRHVGALARDFADSDLDTEPAPRTPDTAALAASTPCAVKLRSLLLDVDWSDSLPDLDGFASAALDLATTYPDQAADITRAVRAALIVRRAELLTAVTARTNGILAWINRTPEAVAA